MRRHNQHYDYSERHIERMVNESIGISPKKYGNIVQLHNFIKMTRDNSRQKNITGFCYGAGYFDQSHLINAFKKYTGNVEKKFIKLNNRLLKIPKELE